MRDNTTIKHEPNNWFKAVKVLKRVTLFLHVLLVITSLLTVAFKIGDTSEKIQHYIDIALLTTLILEAFAWFIAYLLNMPIFRLPALTKEIELDVLKKAGNPLVGAVPVGRENFSAQLADVTSIAEDQLSDAVKIEMQYIRDTIHVSRMHDLSNLIEKGKSKTTLLTLDNKVVSTYTLFPVKEICHKEISTQVIELHKMPNIKHPKGVFIENFSIAKESIDLSNLILCVESLCQSISGLFSAKKVIKGMFLYTVIKTGNYTVRNFYKALGFIKSEEHKLSGYDVYVLKFGNKPSKLIELRVYQLLKKKQFTTVNL